LTARLFTLHERFNETRSAGKKMGNMENSPTSETTDLLELWRVLVRFKRWVFAGVAISLGGGITLLALLSPVWESAGTILVGEVGRLTEGVVVAEKYHIEPPGRAAERLKLRAFMDAVLTTLQIPTDEDNGRARLYRETLKVKLLPGTDLIEFKVRGYSREDAERLAKATIDRLQIIHTKLAEPTITHLRLQLEYVQSQIQKITAEQAELQKTAGLKEQAGPGSRFAENVLLAEVLLTKGKELRDFEARKLALEEQLSPQRTYPTALLGDIFVPVKQSAPNKLSLWGLSIIVGLVAGVLAAFLANAMTARGGGIAPTAV
jgi:hypothetical protein